jgi:transposase
MVHAGLDLSRRRLDVCLLTDHAELVEQTAAPPDADGLRGLVARVARYRQPVRAVIESMNGARFVHDTLEEHGWEVLVADAQKVKGLAPLACKTDKIDARVLAVLSQRDLVRDCPANCVRGRGGLVMVVAFSRGSGLRSGSSARRVARSRCGCAAT